MQIILHSGSYIKSINITWWMFKFLPLLYIVLGQFSKTTRKHKHFKWKTTVLTLGMMATLVQGAAWADAAADEDEEKHKEDHTTNDRRHRKCTRIFPAFFPAFFTEKTKTNHTLYKTSVNFNRTFNRDVNVISLGVT